jgi:hypothetical protein
MTKFFYPKHNLPEKIIHDCGADLNSAFQCRPCNVKVNTLEEMRAHINSTGANG